MTWKHNTHTPVHNTRCTSTLRLTHTCLQNNHLLPLVHHYGSLNWILLYTHSLCCCDAVTLDKGSCRENQRSHCKRSHHSGETLPLQVNGWVCHWHVNIENVIVPFWTCLTWLEHFNKKWNSNKQNLLYTPRCGIKTLSTPRQVFLEKQSFSSQFHLL